MYDEYTQTVLDILAFGLWDDTHTNGVLDTYKITDEALRSSGRMISSDGSDISIDLINMYRSMTATIALAGGYS